MTIKLTYFKQNSGKYYSEAECVYPTAIVNADMPSMDDIFDYVRWMKYANRLPGVVATHASDFLVLVEVPEHPNNHPRVIL